MTLKEARKYLSQAKKMDIAVQLVYEEHQELHKKIIQLVANGLSESAADEQLDMVISSDEKMVREYIDKYREISALIYSLRPGAVREVLERRYLLGQHWDPRQDPKGNWIPSIPEDMGYSRERVMQLHRAGLRLIAQRLEGKKVPP